MNHEVMTIDEFEDLAFTHGADLAAWPDPDGARAAAFLEANPAGAAVIERARRVEAALTAARPADPVPSAELMSRILADAASVPPVPFPATAAEAAPPAGAGLLARLRIMLSPAAACAASAALGVWLGYAGPVDFTGVAADALGVEAGTDFAFLDTAMASPMAGFIEALEVGE